MEGGIISDFRYRDWLNSSNLKKKKNLSNYFLQLETISLKLKKSNLQLRTFCCIIGYWKGKWSNRAGFKLSDQGYSLSFVGAPSCRSKLPEATRDTTSNRFVIVRGIPNNRFIVYPLIPLVSIENKGAARFEDAALFCFRSERW